MPDRATRKLSCAREGSVKTLRFTQQLSPGSNRELNQNNVGTKDCVWMRSSGVLALLKLLQAISFEDWEGMDGLDPAGLWL